MANQGDLSPQWRLLLALVIVLGIVILGFLLIYAWVFVIPVALAGVVAFAGARRVFRRREAEG